MKQTLIFLALVLLAQSSQAANPAIIYGSGGYALNLQPNGIEQKSGIKILDLSVDPTASAVDAPIGSYGSFGGKIYVKQDAGSTTNWDTLSTEAALALKEDSLGNPVSDGQALVSTSAGVRTWVDFPVNLPSLLKGSLITSNGTFTGELAVGTDGQFLVANSASADGSGLEWQTVALSPTTTEGDLILRGATEDIRLPIGAADYLLTSNGTTASWQPAPVSTTLTTKGDLQTFDTANARLPVGLDGEFLVADSTTATGLKYTASLQGKLNPVTDWQSFTPTGGFTTNTVYDGKYRRVGDSADLQYQLDFSGLPSGTFYLNPPSGLAIDNAKLVNDNVSGTERIYLGSGVILDVSTGGSRYILYANYNKNSGLIEVRASNSSQTYLQDATASSSTPMSIASGDVAYLTLKNVPIQGWTSGLDAAVQDIQLTAQTANEFDVLVSNAGVVTGDDYDVIDGNCTVNSTGNFTCNFNTGIFTESPKCGTTINQANSATIVTQIDTVTPSSVNYLTYATNDGSQGPNSRGVKLTCSKQGADVNKSQVIAGTFENIDSTDIRTLDSKNNSSQSITASVTNIPFTTVDDPYGIWDGDELAADKDGWYFLDGAEVATSGSTRTIDAWVDRGSGYVKEDRCNNSVNSSLQKFQCIIKLASGNKLAIRSDVSHTLSNNDLHRFKIVQSADYEAIVKNLYADNVTECETKFLLADTSSAGTLSDLTFSGLTVGKKYSVYLKGSFSLTGYKGISIIHNSLTLDRVEVENAQELDASVTAFFTSANTSVTFSSVTGNAVVRGTGTGFGTYARLCELPDTTILN